MNKIKHLIGLTFLVVITFSQASFVLTSKAQGQEVHQGKVVYYCPMHPSYTSDRPGRCPICNMDLVKQESSKPENHSERAALPSISISQEKQQILNIKTTPATYQNLEQILRVPARVTPDETRLYHIHTKVDGYIEELYVNFVGQHVTKEHPLFSVYAPELVVAQNELIQALKTDSSSRNNSLIETTKNRLLIQDVPETEIAELQRTLVAKRDIIFRSPIDGFVTQKTAIHGMRVTPDMILYDIADLSNVWVIADIYEMDLPFVSIGQTADIKFAYLPEKLFQGTVSYIYPEVSDITRTIKVRIGLQNPKFELKPGMFGEAEIKKTFEQKLVIPPSALLTTGKKHLVFVKKDDSTYEPREVKVGLETDDYYEILDGLSPGDLVVFEGNFLLDSEAKLKASRIEPKSVHHH